MTSYDETIAKIQQLPEPLVHEVSNFVDFLLLKSDSDKWQQWLQYTDAREIVEADFADYLPSLEEYEQQLASGKVQW